MRTDAANEALTPTTCEGVKPMSFRLAQASSTGRHNALAVAGHFDGLYSLQYTHVSHIACDMQTT